MQSPVSASGTAAGISLLAVVLAASGCTLLPRPGDPARIPADDPRVAACGMSRSDLWMVFSMAEARDFTRHFPGWSEGADELLLPDPALVMISDGYGGTRGEGLVYDMCIAIGPPADALIHHYGATRFDAVRPDLGGPLVPMP
jgi:hypothetical protein